MKTKFLLLIFALMVEMPSFAAFRILHGPYLQNVGEHEATIIWVTDTLSTGWVETAPDDGTHFYATARPRVFDLKIGIKNVSRIHAVRLTGLNPGTAYRYRVCSQAILSQNGNEVVYGDIVTDFKYSKGALTFRTNDSAKKSMSFAMVNDIHERNDVLEKMLRQCDLKTTDMFIFNGDMVSSMLNEKQVFDGFMDKATEMFAGSTPMYYCRGNHETRGEFAPYFKNYFNPCQQELFYMFRQGPACFVVLDCGEDKPDSDIEYYGITAYDEYRTQQAEWLKTALQSDLYRNAPFKIIICHMPSTGDWHGMIDISKKFLPLLNAAKPDIYLCGHLHKYFKHAAGQNGVDFPVIVNSNNTLLKAAVDRHRMDIQIFDLEGRQTDRMVISK